MPSRHMSFQRPRGHTSPTLLLSASPSPTHTMEAALVKVSSSPAAKHSVTSQSSSQGPLAAMSGSLQGALAALGLQALCSSGCPSDLLASPQALPLLCTLWLSVCTSFRPPPPPPHALQALEASQALLSGPSQLVGILSGFNLEGR